MVSTREILLGVALPFAIALIVAILSARRWPRAGVGAALALAYTSAHAALVGLPKFTPAPVEQWLPFIALAPIVIGAAESGARAPLWARILWRAAAVGGSTWLIVRVKSINGQWTPAHALACTAALSGLSLALWFALDSLADRLERDNAPAWRSALPLALVSAIGSLLILLAGHSLTLAQLAGALPTALIALCIASLRSPSARLAPFGVAVYALLAHALWTVAFLWTDLPPWTALTVALAPLGALVALSVPTVRALRPRPRALIAAVAATLPLLPLAAREVARAVAEQQTAANPAY